MRWDVSVWAVIALALYGLEVLAPGAFMLWLAFAASAMVAIVWLFPSMSLLVQASLFLVLAFASVQAYRRWFRNRKQHSDQPMLNKRAEQLVGRVVPLQTAIVGGSGRVQIADAFWTVTGPDLPAGAEVRVVATDGMTLSVEAA